MLYGEGEGDMSRFRNGVCGISYTVNSKVPLSYLSFFPFFSEPFLMFCLFFQETSLVRMEYVLTVKVIFFLLFYFECPEDGSYSF